MSVAVPDVPVSAYPKDPCAAAALEKISAAPLPLLTTVNAFPEAPPELATVSEVPDAPPSAVFDTSVPAVGVTALDAADAGPVPALFVAVTVKVYVVPLTSVITAADVAPAVLPCTLPGDDVTV